ncbi:MAG: PD-(D/E)XK nuclease family protein [Phycisphaeraceae bacterium]
MSDPFRISAKNLGLLANDTQCPRCYWLALRVGFRGVWEKFGPIYNQIDLFTKKHVEAYVDDHDQAPPWMPLAKEVRADITPKRLQHVFPGSNIEVRGHPDGVYELENGEAMLIDFKTSKTKTPGDAMFGWYAAQTNAYAHILERNYDLKVRKIYLVFARIQADTTAAADVEARRDDGFAMQFKMESVEVDRDSAIIPDLTLLVRNMLNEQSAPNAKDGCVDCARLTELYEALHEQASATCRNDVGEECCIHDQVFEKLLVRTMSAT